MTVILVALGSAVGGVLRHLVTEAAMRGPGVAAPVATLGVNVVGSTVAGVVLAMAARSWPADWSDAARYAVLTGLLGGFTTFSAFSAQTLALALEGRWGVAFAYGLGSTLLSVAGCALGFLLVGSR